MIKPQPDNRSAPRKARDEQIASEPPLAPPDVPTTAQPSRVENHLPRLKRPRAIAGKVENGVVRPLDPTVKLPEQARVIIVASDDG